MTDTDTVRKNVRIWLVKEILPHLKKINIAIWSLIWSTSPPASALDSADGCYNKLSDTTDQIEVLKGETDEKLSFDG